MTDNVTGTVSFLLCGVFWILCEGPFSCASQVDISDLLMVARL